MNRITEKVIGTTSNDGSGAYPSPSPSVNPSSNSASKCDLVTGSCVLSDNDIIPWFTSVTDYSFIDNYIESDFSGSKTIRNEYSDELSKLFAQVSLLKSKYRVQ